MLIRHSYDQRFINLMEKLRKQYGEDMFKLEGIGEKDLDLNHYSQSFFSRQGAVADVTIDDNANVEDASVVTWQKESAKPIFKLNALYLIWSRGKDKYGIKRANKLIEAEIKGALRVHDLYLFNVAYCYSTSLTSLVEKGMPYYKKIKIGPVKHFDSFFDLTLQHICYMSNNIAGAVAVPDMLVLADFYVRKDFGEKWFENPSIVQGVNQTFQSFIYSVNFNWRSNQTPFVNVSIFDKYWLGALFGNYVHPDFSKPDFSNISRLQKMFVEEMVRNLKDNPFTFPVMTAAMLYDEKEKKVKDDEFLAFVSEVNSRTGLFNFYVDSDTAHLSSCCRLKSNLREINHEYTNSFGVGGVDVGSLRVVTINLPQISYITDGWEDFKRVLSTRVDMCHDILDIHRDLIMGLIKDGRLPLYNYGFMHINKQFSTVGFIGMYEALEVMGFDITTEEGAKKGMELIELINHKNQRRFEETGVSYNVEQVPGESAAVNFARKDALQFGKNTYKLYSNQYIPLSKEVDMADRIVAQGRYDKAVGGGSILHLNCDEELTPDQMKRIISFSASKGVVYFAINLALAKCKNCGKVFTGKYDKSPCHNADVERFLRIVGYLTPVSSWGEVRREEYKTRQFYKSDAFN